MERISLNGPWEGSCISDKESFCFSATVPGSSIKDLIDCGRLPADIFWRDNAKSVADYENCDFEYRKTFSVTIDPGRRYVLRFERLDTYATVILNGCVIANTQNGLISHQFDVTEQLKSGENRLCVAFRSPIKEVAELPQRRGAFTRERMYTRRMQCTYGWDWVARFISCGICGDAELTSYAESEQRLDSVYVYTCHVDEEAAQIGIELNFPENCPAGLVGVTVFAPDGSVCRKLQRYCDEPLVRLRLDIPEARLWYPLGYGDQPLYTLAVTDETGKQLHEEQFGIRTVMILQLPDEEGSENAKKCRQIRNPNYDQNDEFSGFILKVNGVRVMCVGGSWVPPEPFCQGSTDEKVTRTLELAASAGINMIRVWGGGAFETPHFYRECSRLGIMVTQDFLMACGQYPEEQDWFLEELQKEAEYAAKLLRNQPCLMWWSGDNENAVNGCDTDADYRGRRSAFRGIAPVLYRLDPNRDYLPSSPYGGKKYASNTVGTTHNTQYLGDDVFPYMMGDDCSDYRQFWKKFRARFLAEEPQLGAVSKGTLLRFAIPEDIYGESDGMWNYHTQSNPALKQTIFELTDSFAKKVLGEYASAEDRFFKLRYLQYEWVRLSLEQLRRELWFTSGVLFWMLNDCWPASSGWSIIDYYNKPKDAYYAVKRLSADRVLSFDEEGGVCRLYASNLRAATEGRLRILEVQNDKIRVLRDSQVALPAAQTVVVAEMPPFRAADAVLVAELTTDESADRTFYRPGALKLTPAAVELQVNEADRTVTVSAKSYVHAVELEAEAVFSNNCFSLLPGESRTVSYAPIAPSSITCTAYTIACD